MLDGEQDVVDEVHDVDHLVACLAEPRRIINDDKENCKYVT